MPNSNQENHLKVLRLLEENPNLNQRELALLLGVSLGKVNYCLQAVIDKGWVKVQNFRNHKNKLGYAYLLTPSGVMQKAELTLHFLKRKLKEYEDLKNEIAALKEDLEQHSSTCPAERKSAEAERSVIENQGSTLKDLE